MIDIIPSDLRVVVKDPREVYSSINQVVTAFKKQRSGLTDTVESVAFHYGNKNFEEGLFKSLELDIAPVLSNSFGYFCMLKAEYRTEQANIITQAEASTLEEKLKVSEPEKAIKVFPNEGSYFVILDDPIINMRQIGAFGYSSDTEKWKAQVEAVNTVLVTEGMPYYRSQLEESLRHLIGSSDPLPGYSRAMLLFTGPNSDLEHPEKDALPFEGPEHFQTQLEAVRMGIETFVNCVADAKGQPQSGLFVINADNPLGVISSENKERYDRRGRRYPSSP